MKVVVREEPEPDQAAGERGREQGSPLEGNVGAPERLPGSRGQEQHRSGPQRVKDRPLRVARCRRLEEEDAVRDRRRRQSGPDQHPRPVRPPACQSEDANHGREQQDVSDRVGEVGDDHARAAVGASEHDFEQDRRADGRRRNRSRHAVEPERAAELGQAGADEQHEADVARRIKREVEAVRDRRVRGRPAVSEVEQQLGYRPRRHADAERDPGAALASALGRPVHAGGHGEQDQGVVEVAVEEIVQAETAAEQRVRRKEPEAARSGQAPGAHEARACRRSQRGRRSHC